MVDETVHDTGDEILDAGFVWGIGGEEEIDEVAVEVSGDFVGAGIAFPEPLSVLGFAPAVFDGFIAGVAGTAFRCFLWGD